MKKTLLLLLLFVSTITTAQVTISNATVKQNAQTVSSTMANGSLYRLVQPFDVNGLTNGYIQKEDLFGNIFFTTYLPVYDTDNISYAKSIVSHGNSTYVVASTWSKLINGNMKITESLIQVPNDGSQITVNTPQLHAYQSRWRQIGIDSQYLYAICADSNADMVVGGTYDGQGTSIINNIGTPLNPKSHLLILDKNDPTNVIKILKIYPNRTGRNVITGPGIDGRTYRGKIMTLNNGYIAFRYLDETTNKRGITLVNPNDADDGNGNIKPVHEFLFDATETPIIEWCSDRYIVGGFRNGEIKIYNQDFDLIDENFAYTYSFGGNPAGFDCFSDDSFITRAVLGSDFGSEVNRFTFSNQFGHQQSFVGYTSPDWKGYYGLHRISDNEYLAVANYRLFGPVDFAGITIPAADFYNGYDYHTVTFRVTVNKLTGEATINANPSEIVTIHENKRYDPNDPTQLIPCDDCGGVVTIAPGTVLPDDLATSNWLMQSVNVPSGYQLFAANMETDVTNPAGFQRYYHVEITPQASGNNYSSATHGFSKRYYVTTQTYAVADTDNDGINDNLDQCPNTPSGESVNSNGCSSSQLDSDNDGVKDNADACPNTPVGGLVDANGCALSQIDSDNDGITDNADICPNTPSGETVDANGCSTSQLDTDNDGINDNLDQCLNTPSGASVNSNGCSSSQLDSDNDGVMDNVDQCANTPSGETVDTNGCSSSQLDSDNDGVMDNVDQCANTPAGSNVNAIGCIVFESKLTAKQTSPKCPGGKGFITLAVDSGSVTANVTVSGGTSLNVNDVSITTAGYTIDNLNPNDYVVTVSIPSQQFVQEFGLTVSDAQAVAAKRTTTNTASRSATYVVSGSPNYKVTVNGNTFSVHVGTVNQTSIYLDGLQAGNNTITIKGDSDCQGEVTDIIDLELGVKIYPNPCTDFIYMNLAYNYDVTIYDTMGNVIVRRKVLADERSRFDMSSLKSGVYLVQFVGKNTQFIKKIIKK